ncbi:MAG: threonine/serine exporter family protein [Defluviitaleaceae bacterium]|nr:threonine/serine exporter family protein [Defluviitaleaceae bacterium]
MKENDAVKVAVAAGEIMLSAGAETMRVEETMVRMMHSQGLTEIEAFCTTTGIFACATGSDDEVVTVIKRVKFRDNNLEKIAKVNELSRCFVEGRVGTAAAMETLENIRSLLPYPNLIRIVAASIASLCFAYMFGGTWADAVNALIAAMLMQIPVLLMERRRVVPALTTIAGGIFSTSFALILLNLGVGENVEFIITGAIMPLVPGVALTNAIRDILDGNMLAGAARTMEALLTAVAIAAGVGVVLTSWISVFGGVFW